MKEQFNDLGFEVLDDGTFSLEQHDYCGESVLIDLHPAQLEYIARSVQPNGMAERITTLERRLRWLRDRFEETHAAVPHDMFDRCSEAFEFDACIQASIDVAGEYCADLVSIAGPALDVGGRVKTTLCQNDTEAGCELGLPYQSTNQEITQRRIN